MIQVVRLPIFQIPVIFIFLIFGESAICAVKTPFFIIPNMRFNMLLYNIIIIYLFKYD